MVKNVKNAIKQKSEIMNILVIYLKYFLLMILPLPRSGPSRDEVLSKLKLNISEYVVLWCVPIVILFLILLAFLPDSVKGALRGLLAMALADVVASALAGLVLLYKNRHL